MKSQIILKPGKEKAIKLGHPWIFSGAIHRVQNAEQPGTSVDVCDHKGQFLARAYYNPKGSLAARIFSRQAGQELDQAFLERQIRAALARRPALRPGFQTMHRVVASEADFLPGLIVDQYADHLVFQILTAGMENHRDAIIEVLKTIFSPKVLMERSDEAIRTKEGLHERKEILIGSHDQARTVAYENGMALTVDTWEGHKTGFYLDQRLARQMVESYARGAEVLNCFSYTGGFSIAAKRGGARRVTSVDESRPALEILEGNWRQNPGNEDCQMENVRADVFAYLRQLREQGARFDLIVMDPPKFVSDRAHIDRACRGYKDLNLLAMQLLREGGILATFSCSGLISRDLFQKVVFGASVDAGVDLQILHQLSQADDHPLLLSFPESLYLKGLLGRKVSLS
ncbi:MAG TPA: class I SAM-dependent rRNA methyltransferase [Oligoflexus sp.]|uniref:class I SAM-dependent rRNA methyltransferase n=1 Tax=Oligoflexus sp. TaxID=1971216 RepID=UPI002D30A442|nr:class I SAM-dependent rRNA methyltransferase [Oligoflexus sp.]HYX36972.1 class I SAM-dependent rRNA methyltransferase [Oligoflexus sp.]